MQPAVGRIVLVFADPRWNNGADVAPAVITRAWPEDTPPTVDVRVLYDQSPGRRPSEDWLAGIPLYETRADAEAATAALNAEFAAAGAEPLEQVPFRAFWPPGT
jgi:hypothetical protein